MAMPDPTLGRVQDTGHAGIRQSFQSIMDSLNQNSQMAMSAIENWKQRDYAAQEAEKERLFKADEALKARTHTSKENALTRQSQEKMNELNNKTSRNNALTQAQTQRDLSAAKHNQELYALGLFAGTDLRQKAKDRDGKEYFVKNTDGSYVYDYKNPVMHNAFNQTPDTKDNTSP